MNKFLQLLFLIVLTTFVVSSCKKNKLITDPSAQLEFSEDTVIFDTVFTQIGSITQVLKVYNPHTQPIAISNIFLAGGNNSNFRINVDGVSGNIQDIEIRAKDSLYIFAEVTVDPNNASNPMIIKDSIFFETNGNLQDVDLVAWGQDAYFWFSQNGGLFFPINQQEEDFNTTYTLPTDKPHVVYGYLVVDSTNTLILPAGTQMHFHQYSGLGVDTYASLKVNGTLEDPVLFTSDRLDIDYRHIPGQWGHPAVGGIWLSPLSYDNEINYAVIRNGNIGLEVDTLNSTLSANPTLVIKNSIIENMSGVGLFAKGSTIEASNCFFTNCGQFTAALAYGGNYNFTHCTFGNYWSFASRESGQLLLNNYYEDVNGVIQNRDLSNANFTNCIIFGDKDEEIGIDKSDNSSFDFNYQFTNCILKTEENLSANHFTNCIKNPNNITVDGVSHNPIFNDVSINDYFLFEQSAARGIGVSVSGYEIDYEGKTRSSSPDLGAVEFLP